MTLLRLAALCGALLMVAACGKPGAEAAKAGAAPAAASAPVAHAANAASAPVLLLSREDLRTVSLAGAAGGPVITGSVQPEKRADLRA